MTERVNKWQPIDDLDFPFGSISYSYSHDTLSVSMHGVRTLVLNFSGVIAVRFETECPGFDPLPHPLPMLRERQIFPLLVVEESKWLEQFIGIYEGRSHFILISSDDLVQLLAKPNVLAQWKE